MGQFGYLLRSELREGEIGRRSHMSPRKRGLWKLKNALRNRLVMSECPLSIARLSKFVKVRFSNHVIGTASRSHSWIVAISFNPDPKVSMKVSTMLK